MLLVKPWKETTKYLQSKKEGWAKEGAHSPRLKKCWWFWSTFHSLVVTTHLLQHTLKIMISLIFAGPTSKTSHLKSYINIVFHVNKLLQKEDRCAVKSSFFIRPGNTHHMVALVMQLRHRRHNSSLEKKLPEAGAASIYRKKTKMSISYQALGNRRCVEEVTSINMDDCWIARTQKEKRQLKSRTYKSGVKRRNKTKRKTNPGRWQG